MTAPGIDRRAFLRNSSAALFGVAAALQDPPLRAQPAKARVVEVHSNAIAAATDVPADAPAGMLAKGMEALTGEADLGKAFAAFVGPEDVVGIKVNCRAAPALVTNRELALAVAEGCKAAGVPESNVIIWDRFQRDLQVADYPVNQGDTGIRCYGSEWGSAIGYDPEVFVDCEPPGEEGSTRSPVSNIVTKHLTRIINLPLLKDHDCAGITFCLKNLAYGSIRNTARSHAPPYQCDPLIALVCALPAVRDKTALHIGDALRGQYEGGPDCKPEYLTNFGSLLLSADPVACDTVAMDILEATRKQKGAPPIIGSQRPPKHLATAAQHNLGTDDADRIERVKVLL